jgi:hypothetical protein
MIISIAQRMVAGDLSQEWLNALARPQHAIAPRWHPTLALLFSLVVLTRAGTGRVPVSLFDPGKGQTCGTLKSVEL